MGVPAVRLLAQGGSPGARDTSAVRTLHPWEPSSSSLKTTSQVLGCKMPSLYSTPPPLHGPVCLLFSLILCLLSYPDLFVWCLGTVLCSRSLASEFLASPGFAICWPGSWCGVIRRGAAKIHRVLCLLCRTSRLCFLFIRSFIHSYFIKPATPLECLVSELGPCLQRL